MNHTSGNRVPPCHCRFEGRDSQTGFHPIADRVADDPVRVHVLDRTQVELAFLGSVFGDIGEPQSVWSIRGEDAADEIIVHRRPGAALLRATFLAEHTPPPVGRTDPPRRAVRHRLARIAGFVGEEPVAELRVLAVGVEQGVRPVRLLEFGVGDRVGEPPVVRLARDPQNPAHPPRRESRRRPARGRAGTSFSRKIRL